MSAGSGGVSVRAGPSPRLDSGRRLLRHFERYHSRGARAPGSTSSVVGCALVCGGCGRLAWSTEADADHPHRREPSTALRVAPACGHCGGTTWVDLQQDETALAMREWETHADRTRRRAVAGMIGTGSVTVAITLALMSFPAIEGMWALLTPIAMLGIAAFLTTYRNYRFAVDERPVLPRRWDMALPPAEEPAVVAKGAVDASASLRAPLTGRSCVAYEVGIRNDDDGTAPARTWLLLEQRAEASTIAGHTVDPERIHLELRRERLGTRADADLDESARVFLRQRGFGPESRSVVLFESVLQAGDHAELLEAPDGLGVLRT